MHGSRCDREASILPPRRTVITITIVIIIIIIIIIIILPSWGWTAMPAAVLRLLPKAGACQCGIMRGLAATEHKNATALLGDENLLRTCRYYDDGPDRLLFLSLSRVRVCFTLRSIRSQTQTSCAATVVRP